MLVLGGQHANSKNHWFWGRWPQSSFERAYHRKDRPYYIKKKETNSSYLHSPEEPWCLEYSL